MTNDIKLMSRVHWTKDEIRILKDTIRDTAPENKQKAISDLSALIKKTENAINKKWSMYSTGRKQYKTRTPKVVNKPVISDIPKDRFSGLSYPTSLIAYLFKRDSFEVKGVNIDLKNRQIIISY